MYKNSLLEKLREGKTVAGVIVHGQSPDIIEILALSGCDYVFIDTEHGALSPNECLPLILAAERRGIIPLVRIPDKSSSSVLRFLEIGAMGLIIPDVKNAEEMREIVRLAKYYPMGGRGMSSMRTADFGLGMPKDEYRAMANREVMLIPMLESVSGVENCREIMSTQGVSAAIVGTNDLSQSMGLPGQSKSETVMKQFFRVLEQANELGIPVGYNMGSGEDISRLKEKGTRMFMTGLYGLLSGAAKKYQSAVKGEQK